MDIAVLVIGATGTVGGATLDALRAAGAKPVAFVRDAERAATVLGERTPVRVGDLADEATVRAALDGVDAVLLCSAHGPSMREHQLGAVRAIEASDVARVVKISGSPVSVRGDSPASTGRGHFEVEEALRAIGRVTVAIRPNPFMPNFLDQAAVAAHGALPGPDGEPRVSFVDARDIGRVAAAALLSERSSEPVLEVTGPEALTWFDVAGTMSEALSRSITHYPTPPDVLRQALLGMGRPAWLVEHMLELGALMREPKAAEVTDTVERTTGHPATTLAKFMADHATAFPAVA
ncbi:MAG: NAD(P)H-binding protein [Solirubrobacterales bacterium]|nr:NAD(P)H-binding protein [Solirubrobacterales bacterium]